MATRLCRPLGVNRVSLARGGFSGAGLQGLGLRGRGLGRTGCGGRTGNPELGGGKGLLGMRESGAAQVCWLF